MREVDEDFLHPKYSAKPADIPGLNEAVKRISEAVKNHEKVLIYGDYDVDGVTATTVMKDALTLAGVSEVLTMLPDRFKDGYGMSERVIQRAEKEGVKLVVTVDCGTGNQEIIARLKEIGIDTVVTDHHEVMCELPKDAVAVVNPKRQDSKGKQARELAGVGVAFMVAKKLVEVGLIPDGQEKWMLDLVLIGTICDAMYMNKLNRELCFYGMKVIQKTRRPGLAELMRVARVSKIDTNAIGFMIGPRLNAGGRMESAEISLSLLNTTSKAEAARLALKLDELNSARKTEQERAVKEIESEKRLDEVVVYDDGPVMIAKGDWHEGVIGIIAGRLVEQYKKPAFVFNNDLKGSGRSFGEFNLADALKACEDVMIGGGGHAAACGVKLMEGKLEEFAEKVNDYYRSLKLTSQERFLRQKADLEIADLSEIKVELIDEIAQLEPFGPGNEEPIFRIKSRVMRTTTMGADGKHVKIEVADGDKILPLVKFYAEPEYMRVQAGENIALLVTFMKNEWCGRISVEGSIKDFDEVGEEWND